MSAPAAKAFSDPVISRQPMLVSASKRVDRRDQFLHQRGVQRVERLRPMEADDADAAFRFDLDVLIAHGKSRSLTSLKTIRSNTGGTIQIDSSWFATVRGSIQMRKFLIGAVALTALTFASAANAASDSTLVRRSDRRWHRRARGRPDRCGRRRRGWRSGRRTDGPRPSALLAQPERRAPLQRLSLVGRSFTSDTPDRRTSSARSARCA